MRIPRVFVDLPLTEDSTHILPDASFHYLCNVLRLKEGHPLILFNGLGGQYEANLANISKKTAEVSVHTHMQVLNESPIKITLGQSLSRGERMDYAIQKAVECGIHSIQPLYSERCEVKLNDARIEKRVKHWQQIAISAAEQCGRCVVPIVQKPIALCDWVQNCNEMLKLTLHHHVQATLSQLQCPTSNTIAILIGPEGGLTEEEVKTSLNQGFTAIQLGPRVLRTETAAVVATTAINLLWGDIR